LRKALGAAEEAGNRESRYREELGNAELHGILPGRAGPQAEPPALRLICAPPFFYPRAIKPRGFSLFFNGRLF
jgi:hypothetical protein